MWQPYCRPGCLILSKCGEQLSPALHVTSFHSFIESLRSRNRVGGPFQRLPGHQQREYDLGQADYKTVAMTNILNLILDAFVMIDIEPSL